jgi:hypothetical protein
MNAACCALYITALVAGVLELETNVLHVPDPTVRCICIPIMVAIPLFPSHILCVYTVITIEIQQLQHQSFFPSKWVIDEMT